MNQAKAHAQQLRGSNTTLAQELFTEQKPNCEKAEILHTPLIQQRIILVPPSDGQKFMDHNSRYTLSIL